ncbi:MAG TPA: paraquat-inducible membrane protein A [Leucothrix mucor]|nr:paraquat-inducible membrane protein A [Leucothrix mucor]
MTTAREAGLISCHFCHTLSKLPDDIETNTVLHCPCCQSNLHSRIHASLSRTWALLIAAFILYIPANTYPIMTFVYLGDGQPDTILSGVISLLSHGLWPLAFIIFLASIFIPILKLLTLFGLLLSIHFKTHWRPKDRTIMYRVTEFVGRWSMVDIFVIALLVALVQFGNSATVTPGLGALAFAAVVILTMFAAHTFDPRLIWDAMENQQNTNDTTDQSMIDTNGK